MGYHRRGVEGDTAGFEGVGVGCLDRERRERGFVAFASFREFRDPKPPVDKERINAPSTLKERLPVRTAVL